MLGTDVREQTTQLFQGINLQYLQLQNPRTVRLVQIW